METVFRSITYDIHTILGKPFHIIPFGDIHRDTPSCDVDRWKFFLNRCKDYPQERTHYILLGDWNDFASTKEQKIIRNSALHETTQIKLDDIVIRDNRRFANEIGFMRGHMIGIVDGNHNWLFKDGTNATMDLASRMNTQYMGWLCHIRLRLFLYSETKKRRAGTRVYPDMSMDIMACHGKAGGKLLGTSINQVEDIKKIFPTADIYIMGHDHQRYAVPCSILTFDNKGKVKQKRQFLSRSGSFKKGYCEDVSGYEVGRLLRPSDMGGIVFNINIVRDQRNADDVITTDITATI